MNTRKKYAIGIGSVVLAGTLAIGSVASAAGRDDDGTGRRHRPPLTAEQKCERQEQIGERVAAVQERIADRLATLNERRAAADTDGDPELVARLDRRIERLERAQERVATRYSTFQTWAATNC